MTTTPCPACGTAVPAGRERCPACSRILNEDARCARCHAIAAIRPVVGGYACVACGAPREAAPGVPIDASGALVSIPSVTTHGVKSVGMTAASVALRIAALGTAAMGSVVGGFIGMVKGFPEGFAPFGLIAFAGLGVGFVLNRWGKQVEQRASDIAASGDELRVLSLAAQMGGELYATDVARALAMSTADAEKLLSRMVDGARVVADLSSEGLLRFEFRELRRRSAPVAARVEAVPESETVPVPVEVERDDSESR